MKKEIVILAFCLLASWSSGQIALIEDPDGYSNVIQRLAGWIH